MSKQSDIREGMEQVICSLCDDVGDWEAGQTSLEAREYCRKKAVCAYCTDLREALQKYEDSQGVVIKVDRELPKLISLTGEAPIEEKSAYLLGTADCKEQFVKAGYVAVEPLIKEE